MYSSMKNYISSCSIRNLHINYICLFAFKIFRGRNHMILFNNICNINMLNQFVSTWWCYVFDRNAENHLLTVLQLAPRIIAIVFFWLYIYTYLSNIASLAEKKYHYGRYCIEWKGHCTQVVNPHHYFIPSVRNITHTIRH